MQFRLFDSENRQVGTDIKAHKLNEALDNIQAAGWIPEEDCIWKEVDPSNCWDYQILNKKNFGMCYRLIPYALLDDREQ